PRSPSSSSPISSTRSIPPRRRCPPSPSGWSSCSCSASRGSWGSKSSPASRPMPPRPVSLDEIESIAIGAWILGTGGGGSPYLALLNLRQLYGKGTVVPLIDLLQLKDHHPLALTSPMRP